MVVTVSVFVISDVLVMGVWEGDAEKSWVFMDMDVDGERVILMVWLSVKVSVSVNEADFASWLTECVSVPVKVSVLVGVKDVDTVIVEVTSSVRLRAERDTERERVMLRSFVVLGVTNGVRVFVSDNDGLWERVLEMARDRVTEEVTSGVSVTLPVSVCVPVVVGVTEYEIDSVLV